MSPDLGPSAHLVPPLYPASVYALPDLDALDAIYNGAPGFIYARDGHPNAAHLADQLTKLEHAAWGVVTGSGMGAITAGLLALVSAGDRVIASNRLYGKTTKLLHQELHRFGVKTTVVDVSDLGVVRVALEEPARVLVTETISNPLCRVSDAPALADLTHRAGAKLFVDNTFATPVLCRPLELGADLVMESLTKMIGGHSDVTLGFLGGTDPELLPTTSSLVSTWGLAANPFDCWLADRGLATLELRARAATANAARVADWLAGRPGVSRVVYPGRADHPDHNLAKRLLPDGCGHMLCFELSGGREAVNRFLRSATGIPFSPSLGHVSTTCSHPDTTSHRYDSPAEKRRQGITDGLIRLSVGCEPADVIEAELAKGLS
ncbi:MAG TPA: PLP-dependent transferase [Fimbriiglobus sp.]|nr:PLP-dependent transferase [Fimbriiglobus sp.]